MFFLSLSCVIFMVNPCEISGGKYQQKPTGEPPVSFGPLLSGPQELPIFVEVDFFFGLRGSPCFPKLHSEMRIASFAFLPEVLCL